MHREAFQTSRLPNLTTSCIRTRLNTSVVTKPVFLFTLPFKRNFTNSLLLAGCVEFEVGSSYNNQSIKVIYQQNSSHPTQHSVFRIKGEATQGAKAHTVIGRKELLAHCWNGMCNILLLRPTYFHMSLTFTDFEIYYRLC